jgi:hypothetical protein
MVAEGELRAIKRVDNPSDDPTSTIAPKCVRRASAKLVSVLPPNQPSSLSAAGTVPGAIDVLGNRIAFDFDYQNSHDCPQAKSPFWIGARKSRRPDASNPSRVGQQVA